MWAPWAMLPAPIADQVNMIEGCLNRHRRRLRHPFNG
jgi:hypothetical protein